MALKPARDFTIIQRSNLQFLISPSPVSPPLKGGEIKEASRPWGRSNENLPSPLGGEGQGEGMESDVK